MKRAKYLLRLRLCLAILPVLMLLMGPWAQAEAMTIVICSDGAMKTVQLDPEDNGHSPQECSDCPACILPVPSDPAQTADVTPPTDWLPAIHPQAVAAIVLSRRAPGPLSRGPPILTPRFRA